MSRTCRVWFAIGLFLAASAIAMADGPSVFTTAPRPPMTAYLQTSNDELPKRPGTGGANLPPPPELSIGPEESLPLPKATANSPYGGGSQITPLAPNAGGSPPAALPASPYVGGPPPMDGPPLLQPDFDAPQSHHWLSIDAPTAWLLFPSFSQHLSSPLQVGGLYATTATLPSAPLDFTASPGLSVRADLRNLGTVEFGYRYIASEGSGVVVGVDPFGGAALRSRLDVQIAELTWARHDFQTHGGLLDLLLDQDLRINDLQGPPTWVVTWDIGARVANLYYDSHAVGAVTDRQIVNYFIGGGAKVGVTLTRLIPALGASVFSRIDLGAMMGGVRQQFSETAFDLLGNPVGFGYASRQQVQTVPTLAAQLGFSSYAPHRLGQWQAGYQFEQWWAIGNLVGSTGDLLTHGVFVRWVRNY